MRTGLAQLPLIDPVYPLTEGLHPNQVRKAIELALDRLPALPEWQDPAWLARNDYPSFADALRTHPSARGAGGYRAGKPGLVAACL